LGGLGKNKILGHEFAGVVEAMGSSVTLFKPSSENLVFLRELIEVGKLRAFVDRTYRLDEIAEAHRYVDTGRKKGNVVITLV